MEMELRVDGIMYGPIPVGYLMLYAAGIATSSTTSGRDGNSARRQFRRGDSRKMGKLLDINDRCL